MTRLLKIWWIMATSSFQTALGNKLTASLFLLGKIVRFVMSFLLIYILVKNAGTIAGYNTDQVIFFFLTFNLVDITVQFLFREVYRFRPLIVSGDFDLVLVKPVNPLFRVLLGGTDILDLITLVPLFVLLFIYGSNLNFDLADIVLYVVLILNAFLIATGFHIAVLGLGILTTSVDHTIMIYRDLVGLGRMPVDFYTEVLRGILLFVIPIGIMTTIPAQAAMGILSWPMFIYSFFVGVVFLLGSLTLWNYSLKRYSSASS